ncbi:hypothetical protein H920_03286 [Fukomys damarensis]|uniref:Uncharacterized protein n=1 Tax=Fukomys damarensis TaxID=885580 RepID=A0A091DT46_FUKDA|nr:hypothetical protein H920_03286 [Fukomys damarensis]
MDLASNLRHSSVTRPHCDEERDNHRRPLPDPDPSGPVLRRETPDLTTVNTKSNSPCEPPQCGPPPAETRGLIVFPIYQCEQGPTLAWTGARAGPEQTEGPLVQGGHLKNDLKLGGKVVTSWIPRL